MKKTDLLGLVTKPEIVNFILTNVKCVLGQVSAACLLLPDLRRCVSAMLCSAQKLMSSILPLADDDAKAALCAFWEPSDALGALKKVLTDTETLAAAEFAEAVRQFLRTLFRATSDGAPLYSFYVSAILGKPPSECGQIRPVEVVLLREVVFLLANWDGAKGTRVDPAILSRVFAAQQYIKTDIKVLNSVLNSPLNAEAAAEAAAAGCLGTVITHRGASNYVLAVMQLPPSKHVVHTIVTRLLSDCKSLSFQRCASSVLLRSIPELKLSRAELSELYSLFQAALRRDSLLPFSEVQNLLKTLLLSEGPDAGSASLPAPFGTEVESGSFRCVKEAEFSAYVVESKIRMPTHSDPNVIAPILAALGPAAFAEISSSGCLDPLLPELVANDVCSPLGGAIARYLKAQLDEVTPKLSRGIVSGSEWQRAVMLCMCVVKLGSKGRTELREVLTPEAQCEVAAVALGQFTRRLSAVTESSSDVITLFDFTSAALSDMVPAAGPDGSGPLVSPVLSKVVLALYDIYNVAVIEQGVQRYAFVRRSDKSSAEEKLLSLLAGLVISDLETEKSIFGSSFARSFEALLLTLARLFPSNLYPIISVNLYYIRY